MYITVEGTLTVEEALNLKEESTMSIELQRQSQFWDSEIQSFDAIYTHKKSYINTLMDMSP